MNWREEAWKCFRPNSIIRGERRPWGGQKKKFLSLGGELLVAAFLLRQKMGREIATPIIGDESKGWFFGWKITQHNNSQNGLIFVVILQKKTIEFSQDPCLLILLTLKQWGVLLKQQTFIPTKTDILWKKLVYFKISVEM